MVDYLICPRNLIDVVTEFGFHPDANHIFDHVPVFATIKNPRPRAGSRQAKRKPCLSFKPCAVGSLMNAGDLNHVIRMEPSQAPAFFDTLVDIARSSAKQTVEPSETAIAGHEINRSKDAKDRAYRLLCKTPKSSILHQERLKSFCTF